VISTEESTIEEEHQVQLGLVDLLIQTVEANEHHEKLSEILDQLIGFTEVHFMSEQLIMRRHSYKGYAQHEGEHVLLTETLLEIRAQAHTQDKELNPTKVRDLRESLLKHIATQDKQLARFLKAH